MITSFPPFPLVDAILADCVACLIDDVLPCYNACSASSARVNSFKTGLVRSCFIDGVLRRQDSILSCTNTSSVWIILMFVVATSYSSLKLRVDDDAHTTVMSDNLASFISSSSCVLIVSPVLIVTPHWVLVGSGGFVFPAVDEIAIILKDAFKRISRGNKSAV